jgi:Lon protease-like protein
MQQLGVLSVTTHGEQRFRIREAWVTGAGLTRARVELIAQDAETALPGMFASCAKLLRSVVDEHGEALMAPPLQFDSAPWVGARLTEILPIPLSVKQELLELADPLRRIEILHDVLVANGLLSTAQS